LNPDAQCALAIDPGSGKCGVAVVCRNGAVQLQTIVPTESLVAAVQELVAAHQPMVVLIGNGTGARPLLQSLAAAGLSCPLQSVDEAHTSEAARRRYVAVNPARGWQRLLPRSLRTPDRPYDDYVALILAERWWQTN
jgi:RNase H-fold protein (predicted Holliday junction resolvase)